MPAKSRRGEPVRYPLVNDEAALLWMIEYGAVDLHVWTARPDRPERPDYVLLDLDPAHVPFAHVVRAALFASQPLDALGLVSVIRTTGGGGLHVHVPIARRYAHGEAREFAQMVAAALVRASGGLVTGERRTERRRGVFVDTKMNGHGQQVVSPYSVRPSSGAPVATPLEWSELTEDLDPRAFTLDVVRARIDRFGDLAAPLLGSRQRLEKALSGAWLY